MQTIRANSNASPQDIASSVDMDGAPQVAWAGMAAPLPEPKLLLTAAEAAASCRTSVRTWRSWDSAGMVPASVQLGRVKLWRPLELADWVAAGCPDRSVWEWEPRSD